MSPICSYLQCFLTSCRMSDAFSAQKEECKNDSHTPSLFMKTFTISPLKEQNLNLKYTCNRAEIKRTYDLKSRSSSLAEEEGISSSRLALNIPQKPRLGRKSYLSKAQVQATLDIREGKHATINWALRVSAQGMGA